MDQPSDQPHLTLQGVTGVRGGRTLFTGLTLVLAPGGAGLVRGSNGVGKSSLLRIAAGLLVPAAGTVSAARCALMAEALALDSGRRLDDALMFWAALDPLPDSARRVSEALAATRLDALAAVPVRLLSTGQRRRAALARVVAGGAPLWLLDEPANGLDDDGVALLARLIAAHRAGGGIVLVAAHGAIALPDAVTITLGGTV